MAYFVARIVKKKKKAASADIITQTKNNTQQQWYRHLCVSVNHSQLFAALELSGLLLTECLYRRF